jgi:glycosyltransferase involved in cell wall biosynthesis
MEDRKNNQFISVIVPVYNAAKTLATTLNSLLRQDEDVTEIICVDDCSTDDSRAILKRYADFSPRIKVILSAKNQGTLAARKCGVEAATGKYIMFLDSDDCLTDGTCAYLSEQMQSTGVDVINFAAELVALPDVSNFTIMCVKEVLHSVPGRYENTSLLDEVFVRKNISMTLWNKIYRADIVKKAYACVPDGRFVSGEDIFISFLCLFYAKSMICEERVCYRYSVGGGISTTTGVSLQRMETFCSVSVLVEKSALSWKRKNALTSTGMRGKSTVP